MNAHSQRRSPLRRGSRGPSWASEQAAHPGVRDPRSLRVGDWPPLVNGLIITACVLVTVIAVASAWTASPIGKPSSWHRWGGESSPVSVEYPVGWGVHDLGTDEQIHLVLMRSPWVRVHVIADPGIAEAAAVFRRAVRTQDASYVAAETIHRETHETWESFFGRISENPTARTRIGRWPAVWSQFEYEGATFENSEKMSGYRATITATNMGAIASAVAPTENWREFRPIALRILRSIEFSSGG